MKIYIDADASPVKNIVINEAKQFKISVVLVKSYSHFSHSDESEGVETIYVDTGADAADYEILKHTQPGDIIITQDYELASLGLAKECKVLQHTAVAYANKIIDKLLKTRHLSAKARKVCQRTKGPKAFTDEDREKFRDLLIKTLTQII